MKDTFKHWTESKISISELMLPSHSNFGGKIHGGHILNLMDQAAFACASKHSGNYCVTASVNKVDFLNPIGVGELFTLKAAVNYTGRTSIIVGMRVEAQNIQTGETKHCNSSYFTMVAKDKAGNNAKVPGLILRTVEEVRRYTRSIKRMEQTKMRGSIFKSGEYKIDDYLHLLEGRNARYEKNQSF